MKEKFIRFMQGRYGFDQYGKFLMYVSLFLLLISLFFRPIYFIAIALMIYMYYRVFSKNTYKRYNENLRFLNKTANIRYIAEKTMKEQEMKKHYKIFTCPNCKQKIRIPKGHGKVEVTCPKCDTKFLKRT